MKSDLKILLALVLLAAPILAVHGAEAFPAGAQQFDIPAQSTSDALNTFSRQSGLRLLFPYDALEGRQAGAVKGEFSAEEVLKRLLAGTGLGYRMTEEAVVLISLPDLPGRILPRATGAAVQPQPAGRSAVMPGQESQTDIGRINLALADDQRRTEATSPPQQQAASERTKSTELTVTGTRIRGAQDVAAPTIIITREEIEKTGYATLEDLFEDLPQNFAEISPDGVLASESGSRLRSSNSDRATGVDLRGLGAQSTLTLVNGQRRANSVGGRVVDVSVIPLSAIERVEVVTGGRSAVYGSDAVAGVVNLVTRREFTGAESQASFGWNRYGGERMQVSQIAGGNFSRGGIVAAYDYLREWPLDLVKTGLVIAPTLEGTINTRLDIQNENRRHSLFTAGRFALTDRIELYADGLYADKDFSFVNEFFYLDADDSFSVIDQSGHQYSASAGARFDLAGGWTLDVSGATGVTDTETYALGYYNFGCFSFGCLIEEYDSSRQTHTRTSSASAVADGLLFAIGGMRPRMALGVETRREIFRSFAVDPGAQDDDKARGINAAFAELLLPWVENGTRPGLRRFETSLAGRYDEYDGFGGAFTPQLGVTWVVNGSLTLRAAYSEAFRAPALVEAGSQNNLQLSQRSDPAVGGSSPMLMLAGDNPALEPEEARTWSMSVDLTPAFAPFAQLSLSYFNVEYEGRIDTPVFNTTDRILILQRESRFLDLITRNPTQAQVDAFMAQANGGPLLNFSGLPWDQQTTPILTAFPGLVLFDNRVNNIAVETVDGLDLQLRTDFDTGIGALNFGLNATFTLDHERSVTTTSPSFTLLNEVGKPVDFRLRAQAGWRRGAFGAYVHVNYVDSYANPFTNPVSAMSTWTTTDLTLRLDGSALAGGGWLQGFSAALSASNLFDQDPPPFIGSQIGVAYDATNASGTGRYLNLRLVKNW